LYIARGPNFWYGGPPPRVAFVESVAGDIGKPASVKAAAVWFRVNSALGFSGIIVIVSAITLRAIALYCDGRNGSVCVRLLSGVDA
jgi:hypothetical protein